MKAWDGIAFAMGAAGFVLLVTGVALIYPPAALIVSGGLLLVWSYLAARAGVTAGAPQH